MENKVKRNAAARPRGLRGMIGDHRGLTMVELLVVTVIVLLISAMVVMGTQIAVSSYNKITDKSNAEVLLSTTVTMLRTEFVTAGEIEAEDGSITFTKGSTGIVTTIRCGETAGDTSGEQIIIAQSGTVRPLVQNITATNHLLVRFGDVSYDGKTITVSQLEVVKAGSDTVLCSVDSVVF